MSAFIVFGVSYSSLRPIADACIKRQIAKVRKEDKDFTMSQSDFNAAVEVKQGELFNGKRKAKPISAPFGSPHPCSDYISVAEKTGKFKDMLIMVRGDSIKGEDKWKPYMIANGR
ncbi:hypothetical protein [Undibacterium crateris]|uniref:hypothetical protein n=1 Tax=Undibacterium crateris TaxID=2528175 RepID=UPI001389529A|nr:hypothetical protein [Undibacterium crateris]NDI85091.1 hypothetical protein [Undibacterium crateris]